MSFMKRRFVLFTVFALVAAFAVSACGGSKSKSGGSGSTGAGTTNAKTIKAPTVKFALNAGTGLYAAQRWIYKPFKAGAFAKPMSHKLALAKAAIAGAFAFTRLKAAVADAKQSKVLSPVVTPISAVQAKLIEVVNQAKRGKFNAGAINGLNSDLGQMQSVASAKGAPIKAVAAHIPGLG